MKYRYSFITNSSSSSYIVISNEGKYELENAYEHKPFFINSNQGETEFGWDFTIYRNVYDRINFAYLQAMYVENQDWLGMLDKVIKEHTGASKVINELSLDYGSSNWSYIDHQSCSYEGENIEMFESEEKLKDFLFNSKSYIQGGNDNGDSWYY